MAVYSDDLTAVEIGKNFLAGVLPLSSNQPPTADAGPSGPVAFQGASHDGCLCHR